MPYPTTPHATAPYTRPDHTVLSSPQVSCYLEDLGLQHIQVDKGGGMSDGSVDDRHGIAVLPQEIQELAKEILDPHKRCWRKTH
jgi:hypothetical protein